MKKLYFLIACIALAGMLASCSSKKVEIKSGGLSIEFNDKMMTRLKIDLPKDALVSDSFTHSEYIEALNFVASEFDLKSQNGYLTTGALGDGKVHELKGVYDKGATKIEKIVRVFEYEKYPEVLFFNTSYVNNGDEEVLIEKWVNNKYQVLKSNNDTVPDFWSFQGRSTAARADWVLPLRPGFLQDNFMGMNDSDYGGGVPVVDIWRKDVGIAIGHLEMVPKEVSLPVYYGKNDDYVTINIEKSYGYEDLVSIAKGDTLNTLETFVAAHKGDYYVPLKKFSEIMQNKGLEFVEPEPTAFESIWCGWGYERTFTKEEIIGTLPKVKELGIKWAVIDDGFQIAEGDWRVDKSRFSDGSRDMKEMVDAIHDYGMKAKLWWAPMAADPGSKILKDDPLVKLINKDGAPQYITWWNSYYMSPAYEGTLEHTKETIEMFMEDWGFDGLKLDGQHMNAVPADYNWKRPLEYPEKSIEMLPDFFELIYHTAREIKHDAVVENCPCGTCMSYYNMPYTNQFVSSDPLNSWQIRLKGKTYKALAPGAAYYGDHVELSDNGTDFATSFGIGAVLGTKFTWPKNNPNVEEDYLLTPEKEKIWKKWFGLYDKMMLSKGDYLGDLYDIGYDKPEAHVIRKDGKMYYAFYSEEWDGDVEFKGLNENANYRVYDYFNDTEVAEISGNSPIVKLKFKEFMLLSLTPVE
jgi:alpha-galactosidase